MKSKGTNEKAMALLCKAKGQTKKQWYYLKTIGTNDKKHWLYYEKHRNQRKHIGFNKKSIGTNETGLFLVCKA